MDGKQRLATTILAAVFCGGLILAPLEAEAGLPAPLPTQIPMRDISEPPTPPLEARSFSPTKTVRTPRRKQSTKRRHRRAPVRAARPAQTPPPSPQAPAATKTGPKLEQRQEAPIEAIMPLDQLPEPAPAPAASPAAPKPPAGPKPAQAEFPPRPDAGPAPAQPKP